MPFYVNISGTAKTDDPAVEKTIHDELKADVQALVSKYRAHIGSATIQAAATALNEDVLSTLPPAPEAQPVDAFGNPIPPPA